MPSGPLPQELPLTERIPPEEAVLNDGTLSSVEADARALEQATEDQNDTFLENIDEVAPVTPVVVTPVEPALTVVPVPPPEHDEVFKAVEKILEDGLGDYFGQLPEPAKVRFQQKGQQVAEQISVMVRQMGVKVKKVILLIRDWLLTIPGVNKFFLEQEAKIKTDRILELEHTRREDSKTKPS